MAHTGGSADSRLTLEKDRFYILATKERVSIPVHLSAEMVPCRLCACFSACACAEVLCMCTPYSLPRRTKTTPIVTAT